MVGIVSYGAYIPIHRLKRADIGKAWSYIMPPGEKAVANYDEDSLTIAVAAARDCLKNSDVASIDGLYFASTTSPYKEKQSAALISAVLGLPNETLTIDFGGSLRSGTNALRAAIDAVASGSLDRVLVCAADVRLGHPMGRVEMSCGDGGAAILVGKNDLVAEFEGFYSVYDEIQDIWRSDKDQFVRSGEDRFNLDMGYQRVVEKSLSEALVRFAKKPDEFKKICFNTPNSRTVATIAKKLGFDPKSQSSSVLYDKIGDTGSAMALMGLIEVLEEINPNERTLLASYGNGCDVFSLKAIDNNQSKVNSRGIKGHLEPKVMLNNYNKYLIWRELVSVQPPARPPKEERQPTPAAQWREVTGELPLNGTKCNKCGTPQYPPQRVCMNCKSKDDFEPYLFANRKAHVFSFSHDYVMETLDPPVTITVIDFEGGGRIMCDMTDRDQEEVTVGMEVEMTFRKLYYVGGIYNYWWKCKPVR